jgi:hypothetical protein
LIATVHTPMRSESQLWEGLPSSLILYSGVRERQQCQSLVPYYEPEREEQVIFTAL